MEYDSYRYDGSQQIRPSDAVGGAAETCRPNGDYSNRDFCSWISFHSCRVEVNNRSQ